MADLQERTRWEPAEAEARIFARWLDSGLFHPEPEGRAEENYSIAIPPPNVTGALHMGHALNGSVQDTLIRHNRMKGRRTKWILGTDHAGIATQTQVERLLRSRGDEPRGARPRAVHRARVAVARGVRRGHLQPVPAARRVVRLRRGALHARRGLRARRAEGLRRPLRQGPDLPRQLHGQLGSGLALGDLGPGGRGPRGHRHPLLRRLPARLGHGSLTVATVRPETMLADTAIAVHPADERYTRLVGETAVLPLVGRRLPIIADEYVKPEFGTGALKITPGHDPNDFEIGRAHGLEEIVVIGEDGRMNAAAGERFEGMTALEAREAVVAALREEGRIVRTEPYTHSVPYSHRSGERIEPLISLQWFMRMDELARPAIEVVADGRDPHPPREPAAPLPRLAGQHPPLVHLAPALVGPPDPGLVPRGTRSTSGSSRRTGEGWVQDPDVLDTWFSSGLWPFATLGWPDDTPELRAFYPTDVLSTARDILFLWVARMVMLGLEFTGDVPFDDVYVHSTIRRPDGRRMSKSLGTGIDPIDLIERRAAVHEGGSRPRRGRHAVRAARHVLHPGRALLRGEDRPGPAARQQAVQRLAARAPARAGRRDAARAGARAGDRRGPWILSRLQARDGRPRRRSTRSSSTGSRSGSTTSSTASCATGTWRSSSRACTPRTTRASPSSRCTCCGETLALAHPVIPFVTEELWSHVPGAEGLLMARRWPAADDARAIRVRRRRSAGRSPPCRSCAAGATASARRPAPCCPARLRGERLRAHLAARRAARARGVVGGRRRSDRDRGRARRLGRCAKHVARGKLRQAALSLSILAWVPLPAPGGPRRMSSSARAPRNFPRAS